MYACLGPRGSKTIMSAVTARGTVEMLSAPERVKVSTDAGRLDRRNAGWSLDPGVQQHVGVEARNLKRTTIIDYRGRDSTRKLRWGGRILDAAGQRFGIGA